MIREAKDTLLLYRMRSVSYTHLDVYKRQDLNNAQKTALYDAAGYARSTLDDAPWYGKMCIRDRLDSGKINTAGAATIMQALGI